MWPRYGLRMVARSAPEQINGKRLGSFVGLGTSPANSVAPAPGRRPTRPEGDGPWTRSQRPRAQRQTAHCRLSGEDPAAGSNGRAALRSSRPRSSRSAPSGMNAGRIAGARRLQPALGDRQAVRAPDPSVPAHAATTPAVARRASKSRIVAPWRCGDVVRKQRRRGAGLERQRRQNARQRQSQCRRVGSVGGVKVVSAGRDPRRQPQSRALGLVGIGPEGGKPEVRPAAPVPEAGRRSSSRSNRAAARRPRSPRQAQARSGCPPPRRHVRRERRRATRKALSPPELGSRARAAARPIS